LGHFLLGLLQALGECRYLLLSRSKLRLGLITLCQELLLAAFELGQLLPDLAHLLAKLMLHGRGRVRGIREGSPAG
jgi:hypothetical protein